jgi:Domain of unknown function (DUF4166)
MIARSRRDEPLPCDLADAARFVEEASRLAFAQRQLRSRRRLALLIAFYARSRCRMSNVHLLAAHAITLGRFCGVSASFDAIGDELMPVDDDGAPRSSAWAAYVEAGAAERPVDLRDELWLAAHVEDNERLRALSLDVAFAEEAERHPDEPIWALLRQHMDVTVGARLVDRSALAGLVAHETVLADGLRSALGRLVRTGWLLIARYVVEAARAVVTPAREPERGLASYRRAALGLALYFVTAWGAARVVRRGLRQRQRGRDGVGDSWPLLDDVLGARAGEVHPMIRDFYANPARFSVKAALELHTLPARLWSRVATLLVGQGLYEADAGEVDARFRVFRRADGSMHFVRELYCRGALRVFDSDFVVREAKLYEVFVDMGVSVEMDVKPLPGGALSIRGVNVYRRGLRLPPVWLKVEFQSRVDVLPDGVEELRIDGHLLMQPDGPVGRFLAYKVLRRPEELGCIHYRARRVAE